MDNLQFVRDGKLDFHRWWMHGVEWIAVGDQLPDDGEAVLIWADGEPWTGFVESGQWHYVSGDPCSKVTHWVPFPPGPGE